jgi:hypothetical protein
MPIAPADAGEATAAAVADADDEPVEAVSGGIVPIAAAAALATATAVAAKARSPAVPLHPLFVSASAAVVMAPTSSIRASNRKPLPALPVGNGAAALAAAAGAQSAALAAAAGRPSGIPAPASASVSATEAADPLVGGIWAPTRTDGPGVLRVPAAHIRAKPLKPLVWYDTATSPEMVERFNAALGPAAAAIPDGLTKPQLARAQAYALMSPFVFGCCSTMTMPGCPNSQKVRVWAPEL